MRIIKTAPLALLAIAGLLLASFGQEKSEPDWAELRPVLKKLKLAPSKRITSVHRNVVEIEEADSALYGPVSGATVFLEALFSMSSRERLKPRYWLRIEDYRAADEALKRANEYHTAETYGRLEKIYRGEGDVSKMSVRLWAVARGRRVYALTTDAALFEHIALTENFKKAIEALPEI